MRLLSIITIGLAGCALWILPTPASARCTAASCHASLQTRHPSQGGDGGGQCLTCHQSVQEGPPATHRRSAAAGVPAKACLGCHTKLAAQIKQATHLHGPVAVGACGFCHSPHVTSGKALLKDATNALCYRCHDAARVAKGKRHGKPEKGCVTCHGAHLGKGYSLLR